MSQLKKCKVIILPKEKIEHKGKYITKLLHRVGDTLHFGESNNDFHNTDLQQYELYILSDEEIKEGDWQINHLTNKVSQRSNSFLEINKENCSKIIATTDSSLKI